MNLLITGAWQQAKEHIAEIEQMGHTVAFLQYEKDELPCAYEWVEGIIGNGIFLTHPIEKFVNLRYIQLTSAGFDRVPMDYVKEHNIMIHNARGVYSVPMAEFAVSGVLQLYKQASFFRENQQKHQWVKERDIMEIYGKRVVIVGCGSVGTECAKRFGAFGCRVIGVDVMAREDEQYDVIKALDTLDQELSAADILILSVPLTDMTRRLMNAERLKRLKHDAILVNISRGSVVDERALEQCINRIGGAVLDVFESEPLAEDSILWDMENVLVTPHNSFVGEGNGRRMRELFLSNLMLEDK